MTSVIESYLGWQEPEHLAGCKRPHWSVDFRTDDDAFRDRHGSDKHACPNEGCDHGDSYPRTTVRIVCTSCQAAVVIRGQADRINQGMTANTTHGYGLPPRRLAGLLLWPGEPWLNVGRLGTADPYDFIVTPLGVKKPSQADVIGTITQGRGKRGAVIWTATALPATDGTYGYGCIRWTRASDGRDGTPLRSVAAAAKWINAQIANPQTGGDES
ncbi:MULTISPECIES: hypothetical protein [unclassified Streptomyces]|uniref:hypothetical protein n=1 Tax=unclassified Streptomyces TaxID=2593676 RepID=UPI001CD2271C|nr:MULTISPECIES: hypothetical protein [unclassified Streptomyces]